MACKNDTMLDILKHLLIFAVIVATGANPNDSGFPVATVVALSLAGIYAIANVASAIACYNARSAAELAERARVAHDISEYTAAVQNVSKQLIHATRLHNKEESLLFNEARAFAAKIMSAQETVTNLKSHSTTLAQNVNSLITKQAELTVKHEDEINEVSSDFDAIVLQLQTEIQAAIKARTYTLQHSRAVDAYLQPRRETALAKIAGLRQEHSVKFKALDAEIDAAQVLFKTAADTLQHAKDAGKALIDKHEADIINITQSNFPALDAARYKLAQLTADLQTVEHTLAGRGLVIPRLQKFYNFTAEGVADKMAFQEYAASHGVAINNAALRMVQQWQTTLINTPSTSDAIRALTNYGFIQQAGAGKPADVFKALHRCAVRSFDRAPLATDTDLRSVVLTIQKQLNIADPEKLKPLAASRSVV